LTVGAKGAVRRKTWEKAARGWEKGRREGDNCENKSSMFSKRLRSERSRREKSHGGKEKRANVEKKHSHWEKKGKG